MPAVGVDSRARGLVDIVDHIIERVAQFLAPRAGTVITFGSLTDQEQRVGARHDAGAFFVVAIDEPFPRGDGFRELASQLQKTSFDPARLQVVGIEFLGLEHRRFGSFPFAPSQIQIGQSSDQIGTLGLAGRGRLEPIDRLGILTLTGLALGLVERQPNLER